MTNLGMVGIQSIHGAFLQAYTGGGELHASNPNRNEEETWFLVEVDHANHLYALYNFRTGRAMSKNPANGCANATSVVISPNETWQLISGQPFGVVNAVAIRSRVDNTFLGALSPGQDVPVCGGEVAARDAAGPVANGGWAGWWVVSAATAPTPGNDVWNTVGGAFAGILNHINVADVATLLAALLA